MFVKNKIEKLGCFACSNVPPKDASRNKSELPEKEIRLDLRKPSMDIAKLKTTLQDLGRILFVFAPIQQQGEVVSGSCNVNKLTLSRVWCHGTKAPSG